MKKIMAIGAMAAMVAGAAFAADVSGALKVSTDMFNMEFKDGASPTVLGTGVASGGMGWGTRLQTSINGEKAGAQFSLSYHDWEDPAVDLFLHDTSVWFKPVDMLKVSILNQGDHINNSFENDKRVMHLDGAWKVELTPVAGLSFTTTLADKWINNGDVQDTGFQIAYKADGIGRFAAMMIGKDNFKDLRFGAGYSNKFADMIDMFADFAIGVKEGEANDLSFDAQAILTAGPATIKFFALYNNTLANSDDAMVDNSLLIRFKPSVKVGDATIYCDLADDDVIAEDVKMTVKPGVEFSVGEAACDFGAEFKIDAGTDTYKVSCPFTVAVNL